MVTTEFRNIPATMKEAFKKHNSSRLILELESILTHIANDKLKQYSSVAELIFQYRHNQISHLSGISSVSRDQDDITKLFQHIDPSPNIPNLANTINRSVCLPNE